MNPVVLVHGLATSAERTWRDTGLVDLLGDFGRSVVAENLPGHGGRAPLAEPSDYDQLEDILAAELPDGPLDAVGFSLGGRLLLGLASRHPERFDKLVLAGIGENVLRRDDHRDFAAAVGDSDEADPFVRHFAQLAAQSNTDIDAVRAILDRVSIPIQPDNLQAITASVLVVIGEHDFAGPGEPLAEAIPGATLTTLRGVDHFSTPKSMGFLDATLNFLG